MRQIKFRGKRVDNGEWVYGGCCQAEYNTYIIKKFHDAHQNIFKAVHPETVGQFTGLKDGGVDIYEGDILYLSRHVDCYPNDGYREEFESVVVFKNGAFLCNGRRLIGWDSLKITGNIHDKTNNDGI